MEEYLDPTVAVDLERACAQVSDASEALQTIHDVRAGLMGRSKGKGKGQGESKGKPSGRSTSDPQAATRAKEAKSKCYVCGKMGHWSGDPECAGPPASSQPAKALPSRGVNQTELDTDLVPVHDVFVTEPDVADTGLEAPVRDARQAVTDSACRFSVAGSRWYADSRKALEDAGLLEFLTETAEHEHYRLTRQQRHARQLHPRQKSGSDRREGLPDRVLGGRERSIRIAPGTRFPGELRRRDGHEPKEPRAPYRLRQRSAREQRRRPLRDRPEARIVACHL